MKAMIWIGITVGGLVGSFVGAMLDHGNYLGGWSIILSGVGSIVGVFIGYKIGKNYLD